MGILPYMQGRSSRAARHTHHSYVHKFKEIAGIPINIRTVHTFPDFVVLVNQGQLVSYIICVVDSKRNQRVTTAKYTLNCFFHPRLRVDWKRNQRAMTVKHTLVVLSEDYFCNKLCDTHLFSPPERLLDCALYPTSNFHACL